MRQAWPIIEPHTPFVPGWHIDAIVEHLEAVTHGEIRNLLINVPPRHMKSLLVSVLWPAWEWIQHPERRWLYSSYAASLSIRDSVKCRTLIESPWYQSFWGDRYALASDQNTKTRFDNNRSGYRIATSVGGAATGEGGDRIVCDDPHNVQEAESDSIRKSDARLVGRGDVDAGERSQDGAKVVVMQRCHQQDLSGHLLEQGGWEHLCLPAEYEGPGARHLDRLLRSAHAAGRTAVGASGSVRKEIAELKISLGSYAAAGQLQQRPSPAGGGIIKRHWFRFWQPPGANLPPVIGAAPGWHASGRSLRTRSRHVEEQAQSWDCSFKDLETSDYVVGQVWARLGCCFLLVDQVRARMDCPATVKAVREMSSKWPGLLAKLIEDKANGSAVIQMLTHEIPGILPGESARRKDRAGVGDQSLDRSRQRLSAAPGLRALGKRLHRGVRPVSQRRSRRSGGCDDASDSALADGFPRDNRRVRG